MNDIINTKNTEKALSYLRKFTNKEVIIKPISDLKDPITNKPLTYLGATQEKENDIIIWLSENSPEESFVHEILHIILKYEGFPQVYVDERNLDNMSLKLRNYFSSVLDHPQVFKRMENDFDLDINSYYQLQAKQKIERFKKHDILPNNPQYYFLRQQDILICLDCFLWYNFGLEVLEIFKRKYIDAYQSCIALNKKINKIGFSNPKNVLEIFNIIKKHIINFGRHKKVDRAYIKLWQVVLAKQPK